MRTIPNWAAVGCAAVLLTGVASACGAASPGFAPGKVRIVAAEATWGSIAAQIGGRWATVVEIITSPGADPHDYEPRPRDAVAMSEAQLVIVNGAGYDAWADKLLDATPTDGRRVIDAAEVAGVRHGGNPHQWYAPPAVTAVGAAIARQLARLDPVHARAYAANRRHFEQVGLARYHRLLSTLRARYAGTPIGISETVVEPLARALGLRIVSPSGYADAVAEGSDPTAGDVGELRSQIRAHQLAVFVENSQNETPDVRTAVRECHDAGIPVVRLTETPTPRGVSFQRWQVAQLERLAGALARATGGGR